MIVYAGISTKAPRDSEKVDYVLSSSQVHKDFGNKPCREPDSLKIDPIGSTSQIGVSRGPIHPGFSENGSTKSRDSRLRAVLGALPAVGLITMERRHIGVKLPILDEILVYIKSSFCSQEEQLR